MGENIENYHSAIRSGFAADLIYTVRFSWCLIMKGLVDMQSRGVFQLSPVAGASEVAQRTGGLRDVSYTDFGPRITLALE